MDETTRAELAARYPHFSNALLSLISGEAYDRGHNAGQAEVNSLALGIAEFVQEVLDAASTQL